MFDSVRPVQVPIRGLGQAQIQAGSGFQGPFGMYSDLGPARGYNPPPGFPVASEEIAAPYGAETEQHNYWCPDAGQYESLTIPEARMRGCQAVPYGATGMPPYAKGPPPGLMGYYMGQQGGAGGAQGTPQGGGQGGAQGTPQPASPPASFSPLDQGPFFWPTLPLVPPVAYPPVPPPGTTCSWEKDVNGNDIYVCRQASSAVVPVPQMYSYGPVIYPTRTFFPTFY